MYFIILNYSSRNSAAPFAFNRLNQKYVAESILIVETNEDPAPSELEAHSGGYDKETICSPALRTFFSI